MKLRIPTLLIFFLFFILGCSQKEPTKNKQLNVVLILVDDLGWTDPGIYGSDFYRTPHIDKLASEGIRFTNAYAACTVCSPTRAAIMTGKYPATINCTDWIEGHKMEDKPLVIPDWTMYMDTAEYTLSDAFREAGYATAHFGKWHLGEDSLYWPENQGFELNIGGYSKGSPSRRGDANGYFPPFGNPRLKDLPDDEYLTSRLSQEAVDFIHTQAQTGRPFFLNFWTYNVHTPLQAMPEKVALYQKLVDSTRNHTNPVYAAMMEHTDEAVGEIIRALKEAGIYEETILVFTSDNGGLVGGNQRVTNNWPLRQGKGTAYEGGVRIPLIMRAPSIPGNVETAVPSISMDLYPTLMNMVGIKIPEPVSEKLEGEDILANILGDGSGRDLFWHYPHYHTEGATPYSAVRSGHWKLIYFYETYTSELYDLVKDPGEQNDLASVHPEITANLKEKLEVWKKKVGAQLPERKAIGEKDAVGE